MSEDNKNPFGEKTFVQSSRSEPAGEDTPKAVGGEKTVVFAQSNLKETFDARTVVRTSKSAEKSVDKPSARLPDEAPPKVLPAELPPNFSLSQEKTNTDIRTESVSKVEDSLASARAEKQMSQTERRAARADLDRKSRVMMAGFAAVVVMALLAFFVGLGKGGKPEKSAKAEPDQNEPSQTANLASESESNPPVKISQTVGAYKTTTEVLMDFDRAAKKAQDHALEYSR